MFTLIVIAWIVYQPLPVLADGAGLAFPRLGIYHGNNSSGAPFVNPDSSLNTAVIDQYAKYQFAILGVTPHTDVRKDIFEAIRQRSPNIQLFAYVMPSTTWCGNGYSPGVFFQKYWWFVRGYSGVPPPYADCNFEGDGFLYLQPGGTADPSTPNVNLAKRELVDGQWHYPVAEGIADLVFTDVYSSLRKDGRRVWDGIFFDVYCDRLDWMETSTVKFDYERAGYGHNNADAANRQAFHDGWNQGFNALANRLRGRIGDNTFPLVGNCGQGKLHAQFNGWMSENWPYQNGGTWYSNMFRQTGGYFWYDRLFRSPTYNLFFSAASSTVAPYSADNMRKVRWVLGSAALGEGFGVHGEGSGNVLQYPYYNWWFDEYAVDRSTGHSSEEGRNVGWLGAALAEGYQQIWAPDTSLAGDGKLNNTSGGFQFRSFSPAVAHISFEGGGNPEGATAARINVQTPGAGAWFVNLSAAGIPISANQPYSITFWAKASRNRALEVSLIVTAGGQSLGWIYLPITTSWKRYQVVYRPSIGTADASVGFWTGLESGDLWLDDVRVQQGITSVYRRDFSYGSVLVNPEPQTLSVSLEKNFRRITGTRDPVTNNGAVGSSVNLGAQDALFLLNAGGSDQIAPEAPANLKRN